MKKTRLLLMVIIAVLTCSHIANAQLGVYKAGLGAGLNNTSGDFNTFVGDSAGYTNTTGLYNTFIGYRAGYSLSFASFTQSDNTVIGAEAMGGTPFSVSSTDNVIIGKRAGYNHYGTDAVIIGTHAGFNNQNGADVVFIGEEAGYNNTEGDDNVFVGEDAGYNNTTASDNTFVGNQAGRTNSTGVRNAFFGNEAGWDNTTGYRNTFVGDSAGVDLGIGHHNTFLGQAAGSCTEHANYNTFVGSRAGWDNNRTNETNNANYNTYLGYATGFTNREGQYNVMIGALTDFSSTAMGGNGATNSYNIGIGYDALINGERVYSGVIGANARVSSDNSFVIGGTTSVTRMTLGIGTDTPNQNASLELAEVDKGFLVSRMSNSERTSFAAALSAADVGMMVYDTTSKLLYIWNGTQWTVAGIQNLALASNTLSIADGNSVDLSSYLDNTDAQDLTLSDNTLALTNDGTSVNLSAYLDNTDAQDLSLIGNTLALTNDGTSVDLSAYLDDTDTDDQTLSLSSNTLSIADGNSVDLSSYLDNTDAQDLSLTGNTLALTNDGTSVDLSAYLDDTDTDDQTLSLSSNTLSIADGNSVDLSAYANTDSQDLSLTGNTLALSNDGTSVDLSTYMDNTDKQNISLENNSLSIENGNAVDLGGYLDNTDSQNLSGATLTGTTLQIDIDNGSSATVDLSSLKNETTSDSQTLSISENNLSISNGNTVDLSAILAPLQEQINDLIDRIDILESELEGCCLTTGIETKSTIRAKLYQNVPNPWSDNTTIRYYIPKESQEVFIQLRSVNGRLINKFDINYKGEGHIVLSSNSLAEGCYLYTLVIDNRIIETKKFVILK